MRFDRTGGKRALYVVGEHWFNGDDLFYYHEYASAKDEFDRLCERRKKGVSVTMYDLENGARKAYRRG